MYLHLNTMALRNLLQKIDKIFYSIASKLYPDYLTKKTADLPFFGPHRLYKAYLVLENTLKHLEAMGGSPKLEILRRSITELEEKIEYVCSDCKDIFKISYQDFLKDKESYLEQANRISVLAADANDLTNGETVKKLQNPSGVDAPRPKWSATDDYKSLYLVYLQAMMYMLNYYAFFPTAGLYSKALGLQPQSAGILAAATPFGSVCGYFFYNLITAKSWRLAYKIAFVLITLGNFFYSIADEFGSISLLILGRLLIGVGGARVLARKYIAFNIAEYAKTKYSSYFVLFSALGMTVGPGLALVLGFGPELELFGFLLHEYVYVSWIMFFGWIIFGVLFFKYFKEPKKINKGGAKVNKDQEMQDLSAKLGKYYHGKMKQKKKLDDDVNGSETIDADERTILVNEFHAEGAVDDKDEDPLVETIVTDKKGRPVLPPKTYPRVVVNKFSNKIFSFLVSVLFLVKIVQEGFLTEIPIVTKDLWKWTVRDVGKFHAISALYVLPIVLGMGALSKKVKDNKVMTFSMIVMLVGLVMKIDYSGYENINFTMYMIGSGILYAITFVAEAFNISLLAKTISPKLAAGYFNAGFISALADNFGRIAGSSLISICGKHGIADIPHNFYIGTSFFVGLYVVACLRFVKRMNKHAFVALQKNVAAPPPVQHKYPISSVRIPFLWCQKKKKHSTRKRTISFDFSKRIFNFSVSFLPDIYFSSI
eukprot:TRINITY_DN9862_c0_g3_i1.p1 TRINITY_DN9862_c0_g3~~TRINITY_DN9862_c0_g3_i1.p1  ORF type:complete len:709 (+),score=161.53 TRINITY_DN9862_c0_g3_i1:174-2300(+)